MNAVMRLYQHLFNLWGPWWPLAFLPLGYLVVLVIVGEARAEHFVVIAVLTALAAGTRITRDLLSAIVPGIIAAVVTDLIRHPRNRFVTPERVWGCELRQIETALFGFGTGQTPADFFSMRNSPAADLFFAIPYTVFIGAVVIYAAVLYLVDRQKMLRFLWIFALVHCVAVVIWVAMPAAPPWYIRAHGCTIDAEALPSAAALLRLDQRFGITYFHDFYSRAPAVFGALPSLHVAYPACALAAAWRSAGTVERCIHVALTLWMVVASLYLDHHWLLDGLLSFVIVGAVYLALWRYWPGFDRPAQKEGQTP